MSNVIKGRFQSYMLPAAQWVADNPVLLERELGWESDTGKAKKGPGAWNSIPTYFVDPTTGGGPGVSDHGALSGLADDDHTQYHTDGRADTWLSGKDSDDLSEGATNLYLTSSERSKLSGIETGATADQTAAEVPFDPTGTGLSSTDVQAAIAEVKADVDSIVLPATLTWGQSAWAQTHFYSSNTNSAFPWLAAPIGTGAVSFIGLDYDMQGHLRVTSHASTANSGYRWKTGAALRPRAGLADCYIYWTPADLTSRLAYIGMHPMTTHTIAATTSSVFFSVVAGVVSLGYSNNGAVSYHADTYTLAVSTGYLFEVLWLTDTSVRYRIYSLSGFTVLFERTVSSGLPSVSRLLESGIVLVFNATPSGAQQLGFVTYFGVGPERPYYLPWV